MADRGAGKLVPATGALQPLKGTAYTRRYGLHSSEIFSTSGGSVKTAVVAPPGQKKPMELT